MCRQYLVRLWVNEWPPLGKALLIRLGKPYVFLLCIFVSLVVSHFGICFCLYQLLVISYLLLLNKVNQLKTSLQLFYNGIEKIII